VELPVLLPPFFLEACGYRGNARYIAMQWLEEHRRLWLSDDGHAIRALAEPMVLLWRRDGGASALERFRAERDHLGRPPWLLVDRSRRSLFLGDAAGVWRVVERQKLTRV
jgi:hypothetical protein